ncbi:hypothetical protein YB2330_004585 [Saitoella coloradoensis]
MVKVLTGIFYAHTLSSSISNVPTVNFLTCAAKGCTSSPKAYPLHFQDAEVILQEMDFNPVFIANILPRVEWPALLITATELGNSANIPQQKPEDVDPERDEEMLKALHEVLLETQVMSGKLVCGNCGHIYEVRDGIPNMLLNEHEIPTSA